MATFTLPHALFLRASIQTTERESNLEEQLHFGTEKFPFRELLSLLPLAAQGAWRIHMSRQGDIFSLHRAPGPSVSGLQRPARGLFILEKHIFVFHHLPLEEEGLLCIAEWYHHTVPMLLVFNHQAEPLTYQGLTSCTWCSQLQAGLRPCQKSRANRQCCCPSCSWLVQVSVP